MPGRSAEEAELDAAVSAAQGEPERSGEKRGRPAGLRLWKRVVPLVLLTLLWLWVFLVIAHLAGGPQADPFGVDFAHDMSGAYVMNHGGNPYDGQVLVRAERAYLQSHGVPHYHRAADRALDWVAYPPLFLWALRPFTVFPFPAVATVWILLMCGLMAASVVAVLRSFGWAARPASRFQVLVPTLLFLGTPQATYQAYFGNPAGIVFAFIMGALATRRRWPLISGLLLSLTWIKPQMGAPAFLLITLFYGQARMRVGAGFVLGTAGLFGLTLIGPGPQSLVLWLKAMTSVSGMAGAQPNMIPLVGLYAGWASPTLHSAVELLTVCVALGLTGWWWLRLRALPEIPPHLVAWLWPVWVLALPYAHFPDEILLAPAIFAVIGRNGGDLARRGPALCVYLLYFSTLLYSAVIGQVQLLWLPLLIMAVVMYRDAASRLHAKKGTALKAGPIQRGDRSGSSAGQGLRIGAR